MVFTLVNQITTPNWIYLGGGRFFWRFLAAKAIPDSGSGSSVAVRSAFS
jgi:hypothetical protein